MNLRKACLTAISLSALLTTSKAQFQPGDLILSFQATGGEGATSTVAANLGAGYSFRDLNSNSLNVINIGSLLTSTYGSSWFDRTDIYVSLNGLRASGGNPVNGGGPVVNGDARNATYVGYVRTSGDASTYTPWTASTSQLQSAGTQMSTYNSTLTTALSSTLSALIPADQRNTIEDYTTPNSGGALLANFTLYNANFLQAFTEGALFEYNGIGYEGSLTLQRQNAYNGTTGALAGNVVVQTNGVDIPVGTGSNEGYFAIRSNGQVDYYAVPSSATPSLSVLPSSLVFQAVVGSPSFPQTFTVGGSNLTANATLASSPDFEVSADGINYSNSVTLSNVAGVIASTNYVRVASSVLPGSKSGSVTVSSTGASNQAVALSAMVKTQYEDWLGTNSPSSENLLKYAIGGATSPTATDAVPSVTGLTSNNLTITAMVRTNDPTLRIFGQALTNLSVGPWSANGVSATSSPDQAGAPVNTARQVFSTSRDGAVSKFLRIQVDQVP